MLELAQPVAQQSAGIPGAPSGISPKVRQPTSKHAR
jgi:hypothetical protein